MENYIPSSFWTAGRTKSDCGHLDSKEEMVAEYDELRAWEFRLSPIALHGSNLYIDI